MPDTLPFYSSASPVLIVGSVAYDSIETPRARGDRILGGSGSYASLAASFYALPRLVAVVGNDFREKDLERLKRRQIDLSGLQHDESGPTFFWAGRYHENFNRRDTLDTQLNVFERFRPDLPPNYRQSRYVMLGNIHPGLQAHVLDQLEAENPFVLADSMDLWINIARPELEALIPRLNLLVINDSESELLTGERNLIRAGQMILDRGCPAVVVKKGEHGAYLFHKEGIFSLPAYPVTELHDPTGAGDSFAGALLAVLAARQSTALDDLKLAMAFATVTASLTVEAFSCDRLETAGSREIQDRYQRLRQMVALPPID